MTNASYYFYSNEVLPLITVVLDPRTKQERRELARKQMTVLAKRHPENNRELCNRLRHLLDELEAQRIIGIPRATMSNDNVNHPQHYTNGNIECIAAIREQLGVTGFIGYCHGNAAKYLWRHEHKGRQVEDLQKAKWYIDKLIETYQEAPK